MAMYYTLCIHFLSLQVYNTSQSSRALGWDTNNYEVKSTNER